MTEYKYPYMPFVSIIVPNYNHEIYLPARIDSIINQTYQNFEIIILDDCSTDNSRNVIIEYAAKYKNIRIYFNDSNSGSTFKQWQKGIELAQGEWIWLAESDDWCELTFLSTLISGIDNECSVAFCQSLVVGSIGQILWFSSSDYISQTISGSTFIDKNMLNGNGIYNSSMAIFKKDIYYKINKAYTDFKFCGDWLFWIQMLLYGNVFISGKYLNYFRKHDNDVSGGSYKNGILYLEYLKMIDMIIYNDIFAINKLNLISKKYIELIKDTRINNDKKEEIINIYEKELKTFILDKSIIKLLGKRLYVKLTFKFLKNKK